MRHNSPYEHDIHFFRPPVKDANYMKLIKILEAVRDTRSHDLTLLGSLADATTLSQKHVNKPGNFVHSWFDQNTTELRDTLSEFAPDSASKKVALQPTSFIKLGKSSLAVYFGEENPVADEHYAFVGGVSQISGIDIYPSDYPSKLTLARTDNRKINDHLLDLMNTVLLERVGPITLMPTRFS